MIVAKVLTIFGMLHSILLGEDYIALCKSKDNQIFVKWQDFSDGTVR
jgi:hypothetical protein